MVDIFLRFQLGKVCQTNMGFQWQMKWGSNHEIWKCEVAKHGDFAVSPAKMGIYDHIIIYIYDRIDIYIYTYTLQ